MARFDGAEFPLSNTAVAYLDCVVRASTSWLGSDLFDFDHVLYRVGGAVLDFCPASIPAFCLWRFHISPGPDFFDGQLLFLQFAYGGVVFTAAG